MINLKKMINSYKLLMITKHLRNLKNNLIMKCLKNNNLLLKMKMIKLI